MTSGAPVQNTGREFNDPDVARAYLKRPPYPDALFARLAGLAPRRGHVLDLGCGPGKLARPLADAFTAVTAIDPAAPLIVVGRAADASRHPNIRWLCAPAETADFGESADLAVAGASLHWMTHGVLFPRLADALGSDGLIAAVDGDGPSAAPWLTAHRAFTVAWVERLGFQFDHPDFRARMVAHESWIDIEGRETFTATHSMLVADLVEMEHSRATWSPANMGEAKVAAFDRELTELLEPHGDDRHRVTFEVTTRLLWGRPRRTRRT